ncbi:hypothetical protein GMRT_13632 [Giardia muris]|uniref:Uncharacterized protein n=1 Tax=Giardia muris TaxID=5742 RepID=A0A4Z1SKM5_GIAMU|nr:hypothetical protein GMRT_13632 [Giardia muris]|eukprot:TNJ26186.1 hypothetical protein GMRT_13632 [Giardia muris]
MEPRTATRRLVRNARSRTTSMSEGTSEGDRSIGIGSSPLNDSEIPPRPASGTSLSTLIMQRKKSPPGQQPPGSALALMSSFSPIKREPTYLPAHESPQLATSMGPLPPWHADNRSGAVELVANHLDFRALVAPGQLIQHLEAQLVPPVVITRGTAPSPPEIILSNLEDSPRSLREPSYSLQAEQEYNRVVALSVNCPSVNSPDSVADKVELATFVDTLERTDTLLQSIKTPSTDPKTVVRASPIQKKIVDTSKEYLVNKISASEPNSTPAAPTVVAVMSPKPQKEVQDDRPLSILLHNAILRNKEKLKEASPPELLHSLVRRAEAVKGIYASSIEPPQTHRKQRLPTSPSPSTSSSTASSSSYYSSSSDDGDPTLDLLSRYPFFVTRYQQCGKCARAPAVSSNLPTTIDSQDGASFAQQTMPVTQTSRPTQMVSDSGTPYLGTRDSPLTGSMPSTISTVGQTTTLLTRPIQHPDSILLETSSKTTSPEVLPVRHLQRPEKELESSLDSYLDLAPTICKVQQELTPKPSDGIVTNVILPPRPLRAPLQTQAVPDSLDSTLSVPTIDFVHPSGRSFQSTSRVGYDTKPFAPLDTQEPEMITPVVVLSLDSHQDRGRLPYVHPFHEYSSLADSASSSLYSYDAPDLPSMRGQKVLPRDPFPTRRPTEDALHGQLVSPLAATPDEFRRYSPDQIPSFVDLASIRTPSEDESLARALRALDL